MSSAFSDLDPFPSNPRAVPGDNKPPIDEQIVIDFVEGLRTSASVDLVARINQLVAKAADPSDITSTEQAGRYGDFIGMCREVEKAVEAERERCNRPLLNAQRALKGRADALLAPMQAAAKIMRGKLDVYMAEQRRIEDERRRVAMEAAREAREAAEAARREAEAKGQPVEAAPIVKIQPAIVEAGPIRGDYGATIGTQTVYRHEIESVRKLPNDVLNHPTVIEAIDKVIRARVRGGSRTISGVRIWTEQKVSVR